MLNLAAIKIYPAHLRSNANKMAILTSRQMLPSYGKVDIAIYECTCNMLICGGILFKFQQSAPFEMRNPINVEFIFCCVAFKRGTDFRGDFV